MAVHGFRLTDVQNLNRSKKRILRWAATVQYGADSAPNITQAGARYEQFNGTEWLVFSDLKLNLRDTARMCVLCGLIEAVNIPSDWIDGRERSEVKQAAINAVQNHIVWPVAIPEGTADPHAYVVSQQTVSAPWFAAREGIPPGLSPVEEV